MAHQAPLEVLPPIRAIIQVNTGQPWQKRTKTEPVTAEGPTVIKGDNPNTSGGYTPGNDRYTGFAMR